MVAPAPQQAAATPAQQLATHGVVASPAPATKAPDTGLEGLSPFALAAIAADPSHPRQAAAKALVDQAKAARNASIQASMDAADSLMQ